MHILLGASFMHFVDFKHTFFVVLNHTQTATKSKMLKDKPSIFTGQKYNFKRPDI